MSKILSKSEALKEINNGKTELFSHSGGRSFYNDGTYQVDVYQLIGTPFRIKNKVTGRKQYALYNGAELLGIEFSQNRFIETVLKKCL